MSVCLNGSLKVLLHFESFQVLLFLQVWEVVGWKLLSKLSSEDQRQEFEQSKQVSKIKTEVKNGLYFCYSLSTEEASNKFPHWKLGQNKQSEVITTKLDFASLSQVMFTVLKSFKHVPLLYRFLYVQEKLVQETKLQEYLIIHKLTLLSDKHLFKATGFRGFCVLVSSLVYFILVMCCVKLWKYQAAWHGVAAFFLTHYPMRQVDNLHWHFPLWLYISIINSQLKYLHVLFCIEVVRWSRCAKGLSEVLEAK